MPSQTKSKIYFYYQAKFNLGERTRLKKFIASIFRMEKKPLVRLNYIFCNDRQLLKINQQYLGHDFYTDIISFGLTEGTEPVEGEIYISIDRVRENAANLQIAFREELLRVIFHGALHLCGYRDKTRQEIKRMRNAEDLYLSKYFQGS